METNSKLLLAEGRGSSIIFGNSLKGSQHQAAFLEKLLSGPLSGGSPVTEAGGSVAQASRRLGVGWQRAPAFCVSSDSDRPVGVGLAIASPGFSFPVH